MPGQDDIDNQWQLLATHRRTLAHYLRQRAQLGTAHEPPGVANGIAEARAGTPSAKQPCATGALMSKITPTRIRQGCPIIR